MEYRVHPAIGDLGMSELISSQLARIRSRAFQLQPADLDGDVHPFVQDDLRISVSGVLETAAVALRAYGFPDEADRVRKLEEKEDLLWRIQDTRYEGEYLVLRLLIDILDRIIFLLGDAASPVDRGERVVVSHARLVSVAEGLQRTFHFGVSPPGSEADLELLGDSAIAASFPRYRKPSAVSKPVKTYRPDGDVPEADCYVEYKYIPDAGAVGRIVGEMNDDAAGYASGDRSRILFVVYQAGAFVPEAAFREQFENRFTRVVVLTATSPGPGKKKPGRKKKGASPVDDIADA